MMENNFMQFLSEKESMTLPDDFEDSLMAIIKKHASEKDVNKKYLRLMYVFFGLGLILGFMLSATFENQEFLIFGNTFTINSMILSIPLSAVLLLLFGLVYKATLVRKGKEMFSEI